MVYRIQSNRTLIKRSISGSPLLGDIRKYTPPQNAGQKAVTTPAQYIGPQALGRRVSEILQSDEHLQAMVYGQLDGGGAMFAATNRRIVMVMQSVVTTRSEEVSLDMVTGVDLERQGALTVVRLQTTTDTHTLRTLDRAAARHFAESVENCHEMQHIKRDMR